MNGFPWSSPGIPQEIPEVPKNSQEFPRETQNLPRVSQPRPPSPSFSPASLFFPASPGKTCLENRGKSMAAPLKSAKGRSLTVSFPRDGFFAPFRARWRDRRAADLSLETRTGKPAESRIPGGDPEPPPGPTLGNPGKSCFLLGFRGKSQESQEFPRIFRGLL